MSPPSRSLLRAAAKPIIWRTICKNKITGKKTSQKKVGLGCVPKRFCMRHRTSGCVDLKVKTSLCFTTALLFTTAFATVADDSACGIELVVMWRWSMLCVVLRAASALCSLLLPAHFALYYCCWICLRLFTTAADLWLCGFEACYVWCWGLSAHCYLGFNRYLSI